MHRRTPRRFFYTRPDRTTPAALGPDLGGVRWIIADPFTLPLTAFPFNHPAAGIWVRPLYAGNTREAQTFGRLLQDHARPVHLES